MLKHSEPNVRYLVAFLWSQRVRGVAAIGNVLAVVAIVVAIASMVFTGLQTRILSQQTRAAQTTAELSFNLEIMHRLVNVLFEVADDPASTAHMWTPGEGKEENSRPHLATQALLDVLAQAISAVDRLPGFSRHKSDWYSYVEYIFERSPAAVREALHHRWWPSLIPLAERAVLRLAIKEPSTPEGAVESLTD
jgi:hypothetical protein